MVTTMVFFDWGSEFSGEEREEEEDVREAVEGMEGVICQMWGAGRCRTLGWRSI